MVDEYNNRNPWDEIKDIFLKMEGKVTDISHNMSILMLVLENKFGLFKEFGGSNSESVLDEKS